MHKTTLKPQRYPALLFTAWILLAACLVTVTAEAQLLAQPAATEPAEESWQAPDLAELPTDWWSQLADDSGEIPDQRLRRFINALDQRTKGLGGNELVAAQNGLAYIKSQFELLALAKQGPADQRFAPPLAKENYFLDEILGLRAQLRELATSATQVQLQVEQSERKANLIQQRRDKLLRDYLASNPESPSRLTAGISRVTARVEYYLDQISTENARKSLKQIESQRQLISDQQVYALELLVSSDASIYVLQ